MTRSRPSRQQLIAGDGPLARVPPVAVFALVIAVFLIALLVRGVIGGILLCLLAAGIGALLAGTWRALTPPARMGRLLILGALIAIGITMFVKH